MGPSKLRALATAAAVCAAHGALNCSFAEELNDPVVTPCCRAQDVWDRLLDGGGCGGAGPSEKECNAAMQLCRECQTAVSYYALNRSAASNVSVDVSSTRVECELPPWNPNHCSRSVKGFGIGVLIATGISLLVVASVGGIAFDWRLLPVIVARQRRKLLVEAIAVQEKDSQVHREEEATSPSAPLPPRPVPPAPPTPTARPPAQGYGGDSEALRFAAAEMEVAESPTVLDDDLDVPGGEPLASPVEGPLTLPCGPPAPSPVAPSPPSEPHGAAPTARPGAGRRPRHYASAYALHKAFMLIACFATVLRLSYIVARVLLVVGLRLAYECLPELLLCILPFVWVACTSRRPKSSTAAVPMSVAYWGPWQSVPRFTTYAVCTICTEIYSTLVAALAVAQLPCNASPLAGVLLYCVGLFVAVARAYCAVLALRLQDELSWVCRRPRLKSRGAVSQQPAQPGQPGQPAPGGEAWDARGGTQPRPLTEEKRPGLWGLGFLQRDIVEDTVRDFNEPDEGDPSKAPLACPFLPDFVCPVLRRRLVGRRILAGGISLALLSAVASAFVARAVIRPPPEERLSSCSAAQNGTSTCAAWELAGVNATDPTTGARKMDLAETLDDCCRGCDEVPDCQAWIFEHLDKRCRWVHFLDKVCNSNPGDMSCRCLTSRGIAFSFKPPKKTYLIWVDSDWE